jgi:hypothetical protein
MTQVQPYVAVLLGIASLFAFAAGLVRHLVKYYLHELKPDGNGGHNLRGRVDRIEVQVDKIYQMLVERP